MKLFGVMLTAALGLLLSLPAGAQECCGPVEEVCCGGTPACCAQCGSRTPCKKYCKVVKEIKEVEKICWEVKCEDFCLPLPRLFRDGCGQQQCASDCDACDADCCGTCGDGRCEEPCESVRKAYADCVAPFCGHLRQKKILVPKKVKCEVCVYKCEVVYCCSPKCYTGCTGEPAPEATSPAPSLIPLHQAAPAPAPPPAPVAPPLPSAIGTSYTLPADR